MTVTPELVAAEDENENDLVYLGLLTGNGFQTPTETFIRNKGKSKAIPITGLFNWTGTVCYIEMPAGYRLATYIFGIGFVTADSIAEKLGFAKDSELRAEAGILYVLHQLADYGHVYYPYEPLIQKCEEILGVGREVIVSAFGTIVYDKRIVIQDLNEEIKEFRENNKEQCSVPCQVSRL